MHVIKQNRYQSGFTQHQNTRGISLWYEWRNARSVYSRRHDRKVSSAGFTLLEMVVSLAIVAIVSTVLSQVFIATLRTNTKTEILKDVKQTGEIALETMVRQIQNAKSVTTACDYTGTTSQSITLINADDGETTLGCVLDGTTTRLASTSAQGTQYLTTPNVTLGGSTCATSTLEFLCKGGTGVSSSVTISFQLAQSGVAVGAFEQSSESFQTSASMRNIAQ